MKEKVLRTKIRSLLKHMPSNCYLEINYLTETVKLKPIVGSYHNNLIAMENEEKFIKKYNNFYKMFVRNDLYYISYDSLIRAYREDKKIIINYHRYHQEEITVQEIY